MEWECDAVMDTFANLHLFSDSTGCLCDCFYNSVINYRVSVQLGSNWTEKE